MPGVSEIVAVIEIKAPGRPARSFTIRDGETLKIGRDPKNGIVLDEASVSRVHAALIASGAGLVLQDLASTNGTFVNGERVYSMRDLSSGNVIDIGASKLGVRLAADQAAAALSSKTAARAMTAQLQPVAVSVVAVTLRRFADMAARAAVADLAAARARWGAEVKVIINARSGRLEREAGASLVGVWMGRDASGLAESACAAAREIHRAALDFSEKDWRGAGGIPWSCSIAAASGQGLKGVVGGQGGSAGDFTILGDPVNLAFRLEELADRLGQEIIIADSTAVLVEGRVGLKKTAKIRLFGEAEEVQVYAFA